MSAVDKYIPHIQVLTVREETKDFALKVLEQALLLKEGKITKAEFDDGVYLPETQGFVDEVEQAKRSINYIKRMIILG